MNRTGTALGKARALTGATLIAATLATGGLGYALTHQSTDTVTASAATTTGTTGTTDSTAGAATTTAGTTSTTVSVASTTQAPQTSSQGS